MAYSNNKNYLRMICIKRHYKIMERVFEKYFHQFQVCDILEGNN